MRLRRRSAYSESALPPAPVNVRVVGPDGTAYPVELAYIGLDERGFHAWEATALTPLPLSGGLTVLADELPPRSSVAVTVPR